MTMRDFTMVIIYALSWYHNCKPGRQSLTGVHFNEQRISDVMYTNELDQASSSIRQAHRAYRTLATAHGVVFNDLMEIKLDEAEEQLTPIIYSSSSQRRNDIKQAELYFAFLLDRKYDAHVANAFEALAELVVVIGADDETDIAERGRLIAQANDQHLRDIDYAASQQNTVLHRYRKMRAKLRREKFGMQVRTWVQLVFTR